MGNLYRETIEYMASFGMRKEDVSEIQGVITSFIDNHEHQQPFRCDFEKFKRAALSISYDNGFGSQEINRSLIVLFKNGSWMERWEHGGAEGWRFISPLGSKPWLPLTTDIDTIKKALYCGGLWS